MKNLRVKEGELRDLLVSKLHVLETTEFDHAAEIAEQRRIPLVKALIEDGHIPPAFIFDQLALSWGIKYIDLSPADVDRTVLRHVAEHYARSHRLIPIKVEGKDLHVAMADPRDGSTINELTSMTRYNIVPILTLSANITRASLLYQIDPENLQSSVLGPKGTVLQPSEDIAIKLVNNIIGYAALVRASDIHFEPHEFDTKIRYRVDGTLHDVLRIPVELAASVVNRVKILSSLRIDERRIPQDGSFKIDIQGLQVDLRVSTLATHWGEKLVLRVAADDNLVVDLDDIGFGTHDYEVFLRNITRPWGMILLTGPTGSGKTTTLYSALTRIGLRSSNVVNIATIEDPVEYSLPNVNQAQINTAAGVDFAVGLRALLRQDPDVLMVGEIRDRETLDVAMRSALVGRLLLSTLHTNDVYGAVPRLLDMGAEPFVVASTLVLVVAQRLARRLCKVCRQIETRDTLPRKTLEKRPDIENITQTLRREKVIGDEPDALMKARFFEAKGCARCNGTGYHGRIAVFEVFEIDDEVRDQILSHPSAASLRALALNKGARSMLSDALSKALMGETSLQEALRIAT
jgi:type IV pilus assembly protein PilB